jgi:uncharacterized protein (TIGR04255 family)
MSVELREPAREPLRNAPLGVVICQVNFSEVDRKLASKGVFKYRDFLNRDTGGYGELTQVRRNQVTIQVGALGNTSTSDSATSLGWRLATRDQSWAVTIFADSVILESRAYDSWAAAFRPRLERALAGAVEAFGPDLQTRIGLRYINALSHIDASTPMYWLDKIQPAFLGGLGDRSLGTYFMASASRNTFNFDEIQATVSLAFQADVAIVGRTAVVFDIDVFRQVAREFTLDDLICAADLLNTRALQIFQSIVTDSYLESLK